MLAILKISLRAVVLGRDGIESGLRYSQCLSFTFVTMFKHRVLCRTMFLGCPIKVIGWLCNLRYLCSFQACLVVCFIGRSQSTCFLFFEKLQVDLHTNSCESLVNVRLVVINDTSIQRMRPYATYTI